MVQRSVQAEWWKREKIKVNLTAANVSVYDSGLKLDSVCLSVWYYCNTLMEVKWNTIRNYIHFNQQSKKWLLYVKSLCVFHFTFMLSDFKWNPYALQRHLLLLIVKHNFSRSGRNLACNTWEQHNEDSAFSCSNIAWVLYYACLNVVVFFFALVQKILGEQ